MWRICQRGGSFICLQDIRIQDLQDKEIQDRSVCKQSVRPYLHQRLACSESRLLAILAKISYQIEWPMSLAPTYEAIRRKTSGKP